MTTSFYPPFLAARLMTTLDHLSRGGSGFNLVTAHNDRTAQNYGSDSTANTTSATHRHGVGGGRDAPCSPPGTRTRSSTTPRTGIYADHTKIHKIDHDGEYFASRGPLNLPPGPQRMPVICQAGGSPVGRDFAASVRRHHRRAQRHRSSR